MLIEKCAQEKLFGLTSATLCGLLGRSDCLKMTGHTDF